MRFHKILCPIDFSAGSDAAVRMAVRIANEQAAEIVLVHAWHVTQTVSVTHGLVEVLTSEAERALEAKRASVAALTANKVTSRLLTGVPWSAIVDLAEYDLDIDLIVVGTQGRTGVSRFLLGSVSENILRHAPCSVLVVRPDYEPKPFTHVTCPIDFSVHGEHSVEVAGALVAPTGGITLLHVSETPLSFFGDRPLTDLQGEIEDNAKRLLDYAAAELRQKVAVPVITKWVAGRYLGARLLDEIERDPSIDLVVMGSHGRTGLRRVLLGSVAEKIVRHAAMPVLVARLRDRAN